MTTNTDQTQDSEDREQEGQSKDSTKVIESLANEIKQMRAQSEKERAEQLRKEQQERLAAQRAASAQRAVTATPAQQAAMAQQRLAELEKENTLMRELATRGLTLEAVGSIEFSSSSELKILLDNFELKQQIAAVQEQLRTAPALVDSEPKKVAAPRVDVGGRTEETTKGEFADIDNRYKLARQTGKTAEGRWVLLAAIHDDPRKIMNQRKRRNSAEE